MERAQALSTLNLEPTATPADWTAAHAQRRAALEIARDRARTLNARYAVVGSLNQLDEALATLEGRVGDRTPPDRTAAPALIPALLTSSRTLIQTAKAKSSALNLPRAWIAAGIAVLLIALFGAFMLGKSSVRRSIAAQPRQSNPTVSSVISQELGSMRQSVQAALAAQQKAEARASAAEDAQKQAEQNLKTAKAQLVSEQQARRQAEATAARRPIAPAPPTGTGNTATPMPAATAMATAAAPTPASSPVVPTSPISDTIASYKRVNDLVQAHFAAFLAGNMPAVLADYAPRVTFDGKADQTPDDIAASRQKLYERWRGARTGRIQGLPLTSSATDRTYGQIYTVRFSWNFQYSSGDRPLKKGEKSTAQGVASDVWTLAIIDGGLKIISEESH